MIADLEDLGAFEIPVAAGSEEGRARLPVFQVGGGQQADAAAAHEGTVVLAGADGGVVGVAGEDGFGVAPGDTAGR